MIGDAHVRNTGEILVTHFDTWQTLALPHALRIVFSS